MIQRISSVIVISMELLIIQKNILLNIDYNLCIGTQI